ncbi:hypothetical protein [Dyella jiangningensis]|uniref:hypothetical protein n=1 Tax=Dyella jiangningensis TaxID=1379159 RepID=UPI0011BF2CAA|nr:hypothetical protein [Dyella jiangningensis]
MKLLRDFFRLRTAVRSVSGRRADARSWTITVPAPLDETQAPAVLESQQANDAQAYQARRREHATSQAHRHLQLVSSH